MHSASDESHDHCETELPDLGTVSLAKLRTLTDPAIDDAIHRLLEQDE